MKRVRSHSAQTTSVLAAFAGRAAAWRYGYDLSRETGLPSGTLYPILVRLNKAGLLEAEWQDSPEPGRPARHAYRLTADGLALARQLGAPAIQTGAALPIGALA